MRVIYNGKIYNAEASRDGRSVVFDIGTAEKPILRIMGMDSKHLEFIPSYRYPVTVIIETETIESAVKGKPPFNRAHVVFVKEDEPYADQCAVTDQLHRLVRKYPHLKDQILS